MLRISIALRCGLPSKNERFNSDLAEDRCALGPPRRKINLAAPLIFYYDATCNIYIST